MSHLAVQFSIIVPIYNAEKTIRRTLERIAELDFTDYECILVNDGSTDKTAEIIQSFVEEYPQFRMETVANGGPGHARNRGIELAEGEYLLFFDADDHPAPKLLRRYQALLQEDPKLDLIISSFVFSEIQGTRVLREQPYLLTDKQYQSQAEFLDDLYELMNQQFLYVVWNKCYRRDIIQKQVIRFKNYRSCEDRLFNLDYFQYCQSVRLNSEIAYYYEFGSGEGLTNRYAPEKFATFKEFYQRTKDVSQNRNVDGTAALFLKGTVSTIFSILETNQLSSKEKKDQINQILRDSSVLEAKKIARTDSRGKQITKMLFGLPNGIFYTGLKLGSVIEVKFPKVMGMLKQKY